MTYSRLIILSGKAGAGKDSVAQILVGEYGWKSYSLAAPLKRFAQDLFSFSDTQLYGPSSARNAPDARWARPCKDCCGATCSLCCGTGLIDDNSPRRVLQLLGEEYLRQMIHPDALTMRARNDIQMHLEDCSKTQRGGIVVTDARNNNDRNNLHDWFNGVRVHVSTPNKARKHDSWRKHMSERRQPTKNDVEFWLVNDEQWPFPALPLKVKNLLTQFEIL